jgi:YgiT-type zinc finger domain-containing protein
MLTILMNQKHGRCPLCGGIKTEGKTTFTVDLKLKFGVVVVREVPALVCDQCGETWIQDGVAERLEQMVEDTRVKNPVVEVANWEKMAVV